ncbi:MAG: KAP family P-loop NTPase fold protein [Candidatus Villigracilaceae bacterium]
MKKSSNLQKKENSWQPEQGLRIGGSIEEVYANINLGNDAISGGTPIAQGINEMLQSATRKKKRTRRQVGMPPYPQGKSVFISNPAEINADEMQRLIEQVEQGHIQHIFLKFAEGTRSKTSSKTLQTQAKKFKEAGAQVWGWQKLSAESGASQASIAEDMLNWLEVRGYLAQISGEYSSSNLEEILKSLFTYLREHAPQKPLGVMSYHYPSYHREIPWEMILKNVGFIAPQVFWEEAHNPGAQLSRSVFEFRQLKPTRPVIPVGAAYQAREWKPSESDLLEFVQTAQRLNLPGAGFYHWDWLGKAENYPLVETVFSTAWGEAVSEQEKSPGIAEQAQVQPEPVWEAAPQRVIPPAEFERRFIQVIRNDDVRGVEDQLGFDTYVETFVQMVLDKHTRPPLTVGISGAWGAGKSFLLESIQRQLEKHGNTSEGARPPQKRIHIVRFNAWDYNVYDTIWPGLVRQLVETLEKSLHPRDLTWVRLKRNLKRQYKSIRDKLIPWGLIAVATLVALIIAIGGDWQQRLTSLSAIGAAGLLANLIKTANEPVASWMTKLFSSERGYGGVPDYMDEIRDDIDTLKKGLPDGQKIVIIIDDLDRCTADKIAGTLEAIKLLLTYDIFFVFMAIDTSVVARAIEQHYKDLLTESGHPGYVYLDKIIQIPFRIPEPSPAKIQSYLSSLLKSADEAPQETLSLAEAKSLVQMLRAKSAALQAKCEVFLSVLPNSPTEILITTNNVAQHFSSSDDTFWIAAIWGLLARWWPVSAYLMHESLRQIPADKDDENVLPLLFESVRKQSEADIQIRRLREQVEASPDLLHKAIQVAPPIRTSDLAQVLSSWRLPYTLTMGFDPKETEAFYLLSKYLYRNPRHIKRLVNTFGLIRMLVSHSKRIEDALVLNAPETMLKWLILNSQWPLTAQVMLYEFENEVQANPYTPLSEDDDALTRLYEKAMRRLAADPDLRKERDQLDYDPDILENLIRDGMTIMTSQQLDLLRTFAINFNPAEASKPIVPIRSLQPVAAA